MLSPGPPSAGGKGYQVRLFHQIKGLAPRHEITLLTFATGPLEPEVVSACQKAIALPHRLPRLGAAAVSNAGLPMSVGIYRRARMAELVAAEAAAHDLVHVTMVRMAPYLREAAQLPSVLDLLDAAALSMRERARAATHGARQLMEWEAARLEAYERSAIASAGLAIAISKRDLEHVGNPPNGRVLPNGIDAPTDRGAPRLGKTVVFSGTMSYFPNADAARWFAGEIFPLVRDSVPEARLRIAGREPGSSVKRLAERPGVAVTGAVEDMVAELTRATVAVCPVRYGSGMQTKILEAMAAGTPVVATSKGLEGIPDDLLPFIKRADSPQDFAQAVAAILREPEPAFEQAQAGLVVIRSRHTWRQSVERLEELYEEARKS